MLLMYPDYWKLAPLKVFNNYEFLIISPEPTNQLISHRYQTKHTLSTSPSADRSGPHPHYQGSCQEFPFQQLPELAILLDSG